MPHTSHPASHAHSRGPQAAPAFVPAATLPHEAHARAAANREAAKRKRAEKERANAKQPAPQHPPARAAPAAEPTAWPKADQPLPAEVAAALGGPAPPGVLASRTADVRTFKAPRQLH